MMKKGGKVRKMRKYKTHKCLQAGKQKEKSYLRFLSFFSTDLGHKKKYLK
jgi:hypothetical protein